MDDNIRRFQIGANKKKKERTVKFIFFEIFTNFVIEKLEKGLEILIINKIKFLIA
jgi:hypothetical protein